MEEITQFRGKKSDGQWEYGSYVYDDRDDKHLIAYYWEDGYRERIVDPKTIGQYIGLKDKSGTLIYHGQIREYKGKMYRVIHEGWRVVLDRNMVMFGENETIIINEDVAYLSSIIYETCEELNQ